MTPAAPLRERCALIADDLTGACDAAVTFKLCGARSIVFLANSNAPPHYDVLALSTESRDVDTSAMRQHIQNAALRLEAFHPTIVFKKIDSTLRGNVGGEIAAAMEAFGCQSAVITPAFPQMGRIVRNGYLYVEGDASWAPIDVAGRLCAQSLEGCVHVCGDAVADAIERGHPFISVEARCDGDLHALAAATSGFGRRVLYAGSAGLAAAVAGVRFGSRVQGTISKPGPLGSIFCIGSDHPITVAQLAALASERPVEYFSAGSVRGSSLAACLRLGHHGIVALLRNETSREEIRELLLCAGRFAALLLSGGDTASLVCSALEAEAIELEGEIVTGLPWGRLRGGVLDGLLVATKSGGFGRPDALVAVADFFTCRGN